MASVQSLKGKMVCYCKFTVSCCITLLTVFDRKMTFKIFDSLQLRRLLNKIYIFFPVNTNLVAKCGAYAGNAGHLWANGQLL